MPEKRSLTGLLLGASQCSETVTSTEVTNAQKISAERGNFNGDLDNGDRFAAAIANIGQLGGDGITDLAAGAPYDDDNGDDGIAPPDDDEFQYNCVVGPEGPCAVAGGGWQMVSIPLADFFDDNSFLFGGNGVLDALISSGRIELLRNRELRARLAAWRGVIDEVLP